MKKFFLLTCWALVSITGSAQYYQQKNNPAISGFSLGSQPDIVIDSYFSTPQLVSVCDVSTLSADDGVLQMRYDLATGLPVTGTQFQIAGKQIIPVRVLTVQGYTYVAGYTPTINGDRFMFMKFNSSTNAVMFCRYIVISGTVNLRPTDICYAGGGVFYLTGNYSYAGGAQVFIAKLFINGSLSDFRTIALNGYTTNAMAIQYYAPNCIYISGVSVSNVTPDNNYGFLLTYDPSAFSATAMHYQFYTFNSNERMTAFRAQRIAKRIYVAGETAFTAIGGKPNLLLVGQLDAGTSLPTAATVYNAGNFRWTSRLNIVNGIIVLSGYSDVIDGNPFGFVNVFFSISSAYMAGSLYLNTFAANGGIESIADANGIVYSMANRVIGGDTLYRIKGRAGNGQTSCDGAFGFIVYSNTLTATGTANTIVPVSYNFYDLGVVTTSNFPINNTVLCYDSSPRLAAPGNESNTSSLPANFTIAPNPGNGECTILLDQAISEGTAEIYSMTGEKVAVYAISNSNSVAVHAANLAKGIYLVKVSDGKSVICQRMIIE